MTNSPSASNGPAPDQELRGDLRDDLVRALGRVPDLAGRPLTPDRRSAAGSRTATSSSVAGGTTDRWVLRLAGNDTHLLGISREVELAATVAAAGVGVGPEVTAFIRPEGYLVTRFIEGSPVSDASVHTVGDDPPRRRLDPAGPRRSGHPGPVHPAPDRRGLSGAGRGPRRADPARIRPRRGDRPAHRAGPAWPIRSSCGRATTTCSTPTSSTTACASGSSTGSTPGWATRSSTWATSASTTSSTPTRTRSCSRPTTAQPARPDRLARIDPDARRVGLPRGDVGRPPAGREHARRRLRRLRRASTSTASCPAASTPAFERALRDAAGG